MQSTCDKVVHVLEGESRGATDATHITFIWYGARIIRVVRSSGDIGMLQLPTALLHCSSPRAWAVHARKKQRQEQHRASNSGGYSGVYRPSTAAGFVRESIKAASGLHLKGAFTGADIENAHQACVFGTKPLRPGALKLLTEAASAVGSPVSRDSLPWRSGMKSQTYLNMKKSVHVRAP
jgi:hypothetical protein